jgi:hypothetical protein
MSYDGQVNFGLTGDYDAMADLDSFALDLEAAVGEIVAATPKRKARARKAKAASANGRPAKAGSGSSR